MWCLEKSKMCSLNSETVWSLGTNTTLREILRMMYLGLNHTFNMGDAIFQMPDFYLIFRQRTTQTLDLHQMALWHLQSPVSNKLASRDWGAHPRWHASVLGILRAAECWRSVLSLLQWRNWGWGRGHAPLKNWKSMHIIWLVDKSIIKFYIKSMQN